MITRSLGLYKVPVESRILCLHPFDSPAEKFRAGGVRVASVHVTASESM